MFVQLISEYLKEFLKFFFVFNDAKSLVIALTIGLVTYYIANYYYKVWQYPRGPFPIPFLGNLLMLRGTKENSFETFTELSKKYGSVYTFWMGSQPFVFIGELEAAKEAFLVKKNEVAGRPRFQLFDPLLERGDTDVVFSDYGPTWENLRRITHTAVRKFTATDKLPFLVSDVIDGTIKTILKKDGLNKPFETFDYLYLTMYNIFGLSSFDKRYTLEDPEFQKIKYINEQQMDRDYVFIVEFVPILKLFLKRAIKHFNKQLTDFLELMTQKYNHHIDQYQDELVKDFADAMISEKTRNLIEHKEADKYLTHENLVLILSDIFAAGSDTANFTMRWMVLMMANHPDLQRRMRAELEEVVGNRMPEQDDKVKCHYINAFIHETMRIRGTSPMSFPHKTITDVTINGKLIPNQTPVILLSYAIMTDKNVYPDPDKFSPDRFLDNEGKLINARPQHGFIPFGMGKRICLGEKFALMNLFLMVANLLQKTNGYEFVLPDGAGSANLKPDPNVSNLCVPLKYKVVLREVNNN